MPAEPLPPTSTARIALLPEVVRNQIAAGEVIERPASVVKELVENALDAGARSVRIDLEEGGVKLVRVMDDGSGMGPDDLALAFDAHATSKLREPGDLDHIASLGFRGEALASMASVARCSILTRPAEAATGYRVEENGGQRSEVREAGGPAGTTVEVRDLFYNVPARRRFLKRASTELSRCLDLLQRLALAHVGVAMVVTHDGKRVLDVEGSMDLRGRIRRIFGAELAEALQPVEATDGSARLFGYVAPPRFSRRDTGRQMWFLNGRPLRDKVLTRVLRESYRGFLEEGRQPVAFLQLSLDPATVDVNVHPAKSEVRLREQRRLFGFLVNSLRDAVRSTDMATPGERMLEIADRRRAREGDPTLHLPDPGPLTGPITGPHVAPPEREPFEVREVDGRPFELPRSPAAIEPSGEESWAATDDLRGPFLQIARTYLVRALPDGFELIDQHALHERTTFEMLRRDVRAGKVETQRLLVPELVEVTRADVELISSHLDELRRVGIDIAVFGEATLAVQGLPARLRHPDPEGLVRDLIEVLASTGKAPGAEDVIEQVLHSAACRSSIMAGDELTEGAIRDLLLRASQVGETDQTCPHARPTRVRFSLADLEKAFHRR